MDEGAMNLCEGCGMFSVIRGSKGIFQRTIPGLKAANPKFREMETKTQWPKVAGQQIRFFAKL
jgi:hypothetical protein